MAPEHLLPNVFSNLRLTYLPRPRSSDSHIHFPNVYADNAFTVSWTDTQFYAFPLSLIPRVLARIVTDRATGLLIVPQWTTQSWFPQMLNLLVQHPWRIAPCKGLLHIPHQPHMVHPLQETLPPGNSFVGEALPVFGLQPTTATLIKESWRPGTRVQYDSLLWGWTRVWSSRQVHPMSPTIYDILAYLTSMFECGLAYRTISAAKSVLSGIFHIPGGYCYNL